MVKEIDYEALVDPLCIPVIKYLRENLGIDTQFCCQGRVKGKRNHSISGYISAIYSPAAVDTFRKIYKLELTRFPSLLKKSRGAKIRVFEGRISKRERIIAVYLPHREWETREKLEEEWKLILQTIKI